MGSTVVRRSRPRPRFLAVRALPTRGSVGEGLFVGSRRAFPELAGACPGATTSPPPSRLVAVARGGGALGALPSGRAALGRWRGAAGPGPLLVVPLLQLV